MDEKENSGFFLICLGILFIILKLLGVIAWSWWWVTLPFWGVAAIVLMAGGFSAVVLGLAFLFSQIPGLMAKARPFGPKRPKSRF